MLTENIPMRVSSVRLDGDRPGSKEVRLTILWDLPEEAAARDNVRKLRSAVKDLETSVDKDAQSARVTVKQVAGKNRKNKTKADA